MIETEVGGGKDGQRQKKGGIGMSGNSAKRLTELTKSGG